MLRRGKPFSLVDEELNTEWTVHPFAWELKPDAKPIKFDWEHTEFKFIKPDDLEQYEHVPQLEVGMRRVLVNDETEKGLQVLREDHESGAQVLALKALKILLNSVNQGELSKLPTTKKFWNELRWMAWHLGKNGRPSMSAAVQAQLFKAIDTMAADISPAVDTLPLNEAKAVAVKTIEQKLAAAEHTLEKLSGHFVDYVENRTTVDDKSQPIRIVTLSASGTVMQCMCCLVSVLASRGFSISLSVLESRPKFEGVSFVENLLSNLKFDPAVINKLEVQIVSDASVATVTGNADYLVLGGDKVLPNGDVSNKIGSLVAAIVAKTIHPECQVIAAFETTKITPSSFEGNDEKVEYNDPAEMTDAWPGDAVERLEKGKHTGFHVEVKNAYFEWINAKWIDAYVSEEGLLSVEDIKNLALESEELEERVFSDL